MNKSIGEKAMNQTNKMSFGATEFELEERRKPMITLKDRDRWTRGWRLKLPIGKKKEQG